MKNQTVVKYNDRVIGETRESTPFVSGMTIMPIIEEKEHAPVKVYGKVVNGKLNLRQAPSKSATVIKIIPDGERVEILEDKGEWMEVLAGNNKGFVVSNFIRFI